MLNQETIKKTDTAPQQGTFASLYNYFFGKKAVSQGLVGENSSGGIVPTGGIIPPHTPSSPTTFPGIPEANNKDSLNVFETFLNKELDKLAKMKQFWIDLKIELLGNQAPSKETNNQSISHLESALEILKRLVITITSHAVEDAKWLFTPENVNLENLEKEAQTNITELTLKRKALEELLIDESKTPKEKEFIMGQIFDLEIAILDKLIELDGAFKSDLNTCIKLEKGAEEVFRKIVQLSCLLATGIALPDVDLGIADRYRYLLAKRTENEREEFLNLATATEIDAKTTEKKLKVISTVFVGSRKEGGKENIQEDPLVMGAQSIRFGN